jgi:hypothetical protein
MDGDLGELAKAVAEALAPHLKPDPFRTYSIEDMARFLHIQRSTAYQRKRADKWPCIRVGTVLSFTEEHVQQILSLYEDKPPAPKVTPTVGTRATRRKNK